MVGTDRTETVAPETFDLDHLAQVLSDLAKAKEARARLQSTLLGLKLGELITEV